LYEEGRTLLRKPGFVDRRSTIIREREELEVVIAQIEVNFVGALLRKIFLVPVFIDAGCSVVGICGGTVT
jgi:hypothetical protein